MGIGVLYGRQELLEEMPPFLTGEGEMIDSVTRTGAVFAPVPHKFEAGTVNAAGAWGLKGGLLLKSVGFDEVRRRELELTVAALEGLKRIPHVHVLGSEKPDEHCGIVTFTVDGVHPHDVSAILDADGIAVRAGASLCPAAAGILKVPSATRASIYFYNTREEIEAFLKSAAGIRRKMGYGE